MFRNNQPKKISPKGRSRFIIKSIQVRVIKWRQDRLCVQPKEMVVICIWRGHYICED